MRACFTSNAKLRLLDLHFAHYTSTGNGNLMIKNKKKYHQI